MGKNYIGKRRISYRDSVTRFVSDFVFHPMNKSRQLLMIKILKHFLYGCFFCRVVCINFVIQSQVDDEECRTNLRCISHVRTII